MLFMIMCVYSMSYFLADGLIFQCFLLFNKPCVKIYNLQDCHSDGKVLEFLKF